MNAAGLSAGRTPLRPPAGLRPPARPRRAARRRAGHPWRGPALVVSVLLHLAVLWWALFGLPPREMNERSSPAAVDVVYEGGAPESLPAPPSEGPPAPLEPPTPGALPDLPSPPPMPRLAEAPPPAPAPEAEALPAPDPVAPPPAAPPLPAPPQPLPPPPLAQVPAIQAPAIQAPPPLARALPPLPSRPAPSDLSLPPPPAEAPGTPEVAALPLPPPFVPAPAAPPDPAQARPVPRPAPPPPQTAEPRARPASPFAGALDLSQGPPVSLGRPAAPAAPGGAGQRRDQQAAASTAPPNADAPNAQLRIRGANLGADWRSAFMAWLREHGYYPRQAAEAGEDGTAVVRFTVDRTGRVSGLQLIGRSGSIWLDAGAQALLRGRSVPPFPTSTREDSAEIDLTINYILRRR